MGWDPASSTKTTEELISKTTAQLIGNANYLPHLGLRTNSHTNPSGLQKKTRWSQEVKEWLLVCLCC